LLLKAPGLADVLHLCEFVPDCNSVASQGLGTQKPASSISMAQAAPAHILIVDDEAEVRRLLEAGLKAEGYAVSEAADGPSLLAVLERKPVDLITLDVRLGGEDGFNLAREVRARNNVPIIMISGKGDMIDRVVGLELGADDYIAKPFHMREVLARVRAVLRRYETQGSEAARASPGEKSRRFEFEGWVLDAGRRALASPEGKDCELTTAEFNLLLLLVERPGRVLSRDELMDLLKGHDWTPLDRSIDGLVARLRKKIERGEVPQLVKTVRGVGYVFAAQVRRS
jgi:DNA-binding response OmpR family regulator